jgi:O-Antigen ligase
MQSRQETLTAAVGCAILFFLSVSPELAAGLLLLFGMLHRWRGVDRLRVLNWFLLAAFLGAAAQIWQWAAFQPQLEPKSAGQGLIRPLDVAYLMAWNQSFTGHQWAQVQANGLWRLDHRAKDGSLNQEIYLARYYSLEVGRTYTQRFELRSDAPVNFLVSNFTARGHQPVEPKRIGSDGDRFRFEVSFIAQAGDSFLRAIDLVGLTGAWTWLELGSVQLIRSDQVLRADTSELWQRFVMLKPWFWLGSLWLAVSAMFAMRRFSTLIPPRTMAWTMLLGMGVQLILVLAGNRVGDGLYGDKNQLAHGAVMVSALIAMLAPSGLGFIGVAVAGFIAVLLGARGALLVLSIIVIGLFWQLGFLRSRRWFLGLTMVLVVGVVLLAWLVRPSLEAVQSVVARFEIWQIAWQALLERPMGYGPGQFAQVYALHRPSDAFDALVAHPHNLFLGLGVEFGWLGILGVLSIWLWLLKAIFGTRSWSVLLVVGSAVLLNVFDYTWFTASLALPLWLAVGKQNVVWTRRPD